MRAGVATDDGGGRRSLLPLLSAHNFQAEGGKGVTHLYSAVAAPFSLSPSAAHDLTEKRKEGVDPKPEQSDVGKEASKQTAASAMDGGVRERRMEKRTEEEEEESVDYLSENPISGVVLSVSVCARSFLRR